MKITVVSKESIIYNNCNLNKWFKYFINNYTFLIVYEYTTCMLYLTKCELMII